MAEMNPIARFFVNALGGQRNRRRATWVLVEAAIRPTPDCLEIGAGNADLAGRLAVALSARRYVATDLDLRQVEAARRHLARRFPHGLPAGLELRGEDMRSLSFPAHTFDAVFAFASLHHAGATHADFAEVARALTEVDRVLQPGGVFVWEEFLHTDRISAWLASHGYSIRRTWSGWRGLRVAAVKRGMDGRTGEPTSRPIPPAYVLGAGRPPGSHGRGAGSRGRHPPQAGDP